MVVVVTVVVVVEVVVDDRDRSGGGSSWAGFEFDFLGVLPVEPPTAVVVLDKVVVPLLVNVPVAGAIVVGVELGDLVDVVVDEVEGVVVDVESSIVSSIVSIVGTVGTTLDGKTRKGPSSEDIVDVVVVVDDADVADIFVDSGVVDVDAGVADVVFDSGFVVVVALPLDSVKTFGSKAISKRDGGLFVTSRTLGTFGLSLSSRISGLSAISKRLGTEDV